MEHAPLRPVPSRPAGPIDPVVAAREVAAALPELGVDEARALALVAIAERPRAEVADSLGIAESELASLLAIGRKELRRTIAVLGGSGWCERAERLISDRMDGALATADAGLLDVHLRNCPRCVEHERRLVQATDALLAGVAPRATRPGPTPGPAALLPVGGDVVPEEDPPADPALKTVPDRPASVPAAADAAASPSSDQVAAAAEVLVAVRTRRQLVGAVTWNAMVAIALILTIASIALIVAGILGAQL